MLITPKKIVRCHEACSTNGMKKDNGLICRNYFLNNRINEEIF